jgi:antitoxin ParD1/3/4
MNVSLGRNLARLVSAKLQSGRYQSPEDVVGEALRLLDERDRRRLETLRTEIQRGLKSGRATPLDMTAVKARIRRTAAAQKRRRSG